MNTKLILFLVLVPSIFGKCDMHLQYQGAWFDISYPTGFKVVPVEKSSSSTLGYDGVKFVSADGKLAFYVFSPQWSGESQELRAGANEIVRDRKTKVSNVRIGNWVEPDGIVETWLTIASRQDASVRRYYARQDKVRHTYLVFGIIAHDEQTLNKYLTCYDQFQKSLRQYAD